MHPSHERLNPSGRLCVAEEHYSVLQQRSGLRDDATNSVAHPLQQCIACCDSAQHGLCDDATESVANPLQVRAATQRTLVPIRCNSALRVATALRTTTQQPVATQCSLPWFRRSCCSAAQRVATQRDLLQQTAVRCHGPQRVATCCSDRNAVSPVATDRGPLQQTTACCNRLQR